MSGPQHIQRVAIVGAGGHVGGHFTEELLKTGRFTITALTRLDSKSALPEGVKIAKVDYEDEDSIASALQAQQFLIITLSVMSPPDTHSRIVRAAVKAGVQYIVPNTYGSDIEDEATRKYMAFGETHYGYCQEIKSLGAYYISMACGVWYEWSLALGENTFGFNIKDRKVIFYDDGITRINVSTWQQCGRALAALLSLPIESNDGSPSLAQWKNEQLFVTSFRISQKEMLESLHRVLGTTDDDWEFSYEPTAKRYKEGLEAFQQGDRQGYVKALYACCFFPGGPGEFESKRGSANGVLGLPKESLDEATKRTLDMVESGWTP